MFSLKKILGTEAELEALNEVLEKLEGATKAILGHPEAHSLFAMLPPGREPCHKYLYGVYAEKTLIGCLDVIRGFPDPTCAYVGLFVLASQNRRQGTGSEIWRLAEELISSWDEIKKWRLGVALQNDGAERFWTKRGFVPTGEKSVSRDSGYDIECALFEKPVMTPTTNLIEQ